MLPFPIFAENAKDTKVPVNYRASINFHVKVEQETQKVYPAVNLQIVDWSTGKVTREEYSFPEYAISLPSNFNYKSDDYEKVVRQSNDEIFSYGSTFQKDDVIETENGPKSYCAYSIKYTQNKAGSYDKLTRPIVSTLYEFDLNTHTLKTVNQLESESLELQPINGLEVYSMTGKNGNDYYSVFTNEYIASIPAGFRKPDKYDKYPSNLEETFTPTPQKGDYVSRRWIDYQGYEYKITTPEGKVSDTKKIEGGVNGYGIMQIGDSEYKLNTFKDNNGEYRKTITRKDSNNEEILCDNWLCQGFVSPNKTKIIVYRNITNSDGSTRNNELKIFDPESHQFVKSFDNYAKYNANAWFFWFGENILLKGQGHLNGEIDFPFLHIPTGIKTFQNDSLNYDSYSQIYDNFYHVNVNDYLTMSDPIEVIVNGKNVQYSGQGTFLLEDMTSYVPLRDFVDSIGGNIEVKNDQVVVNYKNKSTQYKLSNNNDVIVYGGRSYVRLWDIGEKLGFSIKFHEKYDENDKKYWRRYTLD